MGDAAPAAADRPEDLKAGLAEILLGAPEKFVVVDAAVAPVGDGRFGTSISLPEGKYRLLTRFGGREFTSDFWINTGRTTAVIFDSAEALATLHAPATAPASMQQPATAPPAGTSDRGTSRRPGRRPAPARPDGRAGLPPAALAPPAAAGLPPGRRPQLVVPLFRWGWDKVDAKLIDDAAL